jgi:hypothetical protein
MNQLIHNPRFSVTTSDLAVVVANIFPLLEAMSSEFEILTMPRYRTPLRYPGGKQRLAPFIAEILEHNDAVGWNYVEPYAGGAGVAIELLLDRKVGHVYLNDSSVSGNPSSRTQTRSAAASLVPL